MRIGAALLLLTAVLAGAAGCRTNALVAEQLDRSTRDYNQMLRWREFENACATFAEKGIREECLKRVKDDRDVAITDYRIRSREVDIEKGAATLSVEIDYYRLPSNRVKTVEYRQKWVYEGDSSSGTWRVKNLFPAFD